MSFYKKLIILQLILIIGFTSIIVLFIYFQKDSVTEQSKEIIGHVKGNTEETLLQNLKIIGTNISNYILTMEKQVDRTMLNAAYALQELDNRKELTQKDLEEIAIKTDMCDLYVTDEKGNFVISTEDAVLGYNLFEIGKEYQSLMKNEIDVIPSSIKVKVETGELYKFTAISRTDGKGIIEAARNADVIESFISNIMLEYEGFQAAYLLSPEQMVLTETIRTEDFLKWKKGSFVKNKYIEKVIQTKEPIYLLNDKRIAEIFLPIIDEGNVRYIFYTTIDTTAYFKNMEIISNASNDLEVLFESYIIQIIMVCIVVGGFFIFLTMRSLNSILQPLKTYTNVLKKIDKDEASIGLPQPKEKELQEIQSVTVEVLEKFKQARYEAEASNRSKSEFLAAMSHEIRTPMNAIIGMAELLSETDLTNEQQEYVDLYKKAGENLLRIINDILDISKIEAGKIDIEIEEFDFTELMNETIEVYAMNAHKKGIELLYEFDDSIPDYLVGDSARIRQIIMNLISNAIKFTEDGEVFVEVIKKQDYEDGVIEIDCKITDTGIGIQAEKLDAIFERFTQADFSTTRRYEGTGLGLTIAKQLVDLMNGTIKVESKINKGSTFTVRLPLKRSKKIKQSKYSPSKDILKGMSILVVDDIQTNRYLLRKLLEKHRALVEEAENGQAALKLLKEKEFELILLDCRMPEMDGFQLVEEMKKQNIGTNSTIMMLTSDNRVGHIARANALGIQRYLVKPIKFKHLLEYIDNNTEEKIDTQIIKKRDTEVTEQHMYEILLVEDSRDNQILIQAYLKNGPYHITVAENGEEALSLFKEKSFHLILMDIQMPIKDGYTATREIRKLEKEKEQQAIPIIALTANALKEDVNKSLEAGCNQHLSKPIKKKLLMNTLKRYLS